MATITLKGIAESVTKINNSIILNYLKDSSGEDIKVFLVLSMFFQNNMNLDFDSIVQIAGISEIDVFTSCENLDRKGLIKLEKLESTGDMTINMTIDHTKLTASENKDNKNLNKISLDSINSYNNISDVNESKNDEKLNGGENKKSAHEELNKQIKGKQTENIATLNSLDNPPFNFSKDERKSNKELLTSIEAIYKSPLPTNLATLFIDLKDDFKFNDDLIIYLASIAKDRNLFNYNYIQKIAVAWFEGGVDTLDKALLANMETSNDRIAQKEIISYLGMDPKLISQYHRDFLEKWLKTYSMPKEMVLKACELTLKSINKADFSYLDKIISSWYKDNIKKIEDIPVKENSDYKKQVNNKYVNKNKSVTNYKQREYKDSIESMFFGFNKDNDK